MTNPYQPPSAQIQKGFHEVARRKLRIGSVCLVVAGLFCSVVAVIAVISWYGGRSDEVQSTLQPLMPIIIAIHFFVGIGTAVSLYGLARRRTWSLKAGIACLAIAGMSVLLAVSGVGIWALADRKLKHYFKQTNSVG